MDLEQGHPGVCDHAWAVRSNNHCTGAAERLVHSLTFRGFDRLPEDLWLERGMVAVLEVRRYRPQLVVVRSTRGGWWFVGVSSERPAALPCLWWPFLCAFASRERLEAKGQLSSPGRRRR